MTEGLMSELICVERYFSKFVVDRLYFFTIDGEWKILAEFSGGGHIFVSNGALPYEEIFDDEGLYDYVAFMKRVVLWCDG